MARILGRSVGVLLAAFAASNALAHPFTLSVSSGTASIASTSFGSGAWTVVVVVTAGSPAVFTLSTDTANTVVEKIEVECDADCLMTIDESGSGTFSEIRSIVEKATSSPESFEIERIDVGGDLGPWEVAAEAITELIVGGDLTADVTAGPRASSADSDISLINVGGDIETFGVPLSISALHGSIGTINAGGFIHVYAIEARDGIASVEADSFSGRLFAIPVSGGNGSVHRFETRTGGFSGSFRASAIQPGLSIPDPGMFIAGDATGEFLITTIDAPVLIEGDIGGDWKIINMTEDGGFLVYGAITEFSWLLFDGGSAGLFTALQGIEENALLEF